MFFMLFKSGESNNNEVLQIDENSNSDCGWCRSRPSAKTLHLKLAETRCVVGRKRHQLLKRRSSHQANQKLVSYIIMTREKCSDKAGFVPATTGAVVG